jgi:hypothetical protein
LELLSLGTYLFFIVCFQNFWPVEVPYGDSESYSTSAALDMEFCDLAFEIGKRLKLMMYLE